MKAKVKDEYSLYIIIFAILMIDIDIKENKKNSAKIDTLFYDLLIILKDLNDGSSFDNNFAAYAFSTIVLNIVPRQFIESSFVSIENSVFSNNIGLYDAFGNILVRFEK